MQGREESFYDYFDRFKSLMTKCPHHGIPLWRQCQIVYEGIQSSVRALLEATSHGEFTELDDVDAWTTLEELVAKTMNWDSIEGGQGLKLDRGVHVVNPSHALEAKVTALARKLETIET